MTARPRERRRRGAGITVHPLTAERWPDLERLFGCRGGSVVRNCWCLAYRRVSADMPPTAPQRKQALRGLVEQGITPGLIGYSGGEPVGWISLGPREEYARLRTSPIMKPVDGEPVWSIVCFFVDPRRRGQGVREALLAAGLRFARSRGARLIEGYPVDRAGRSSPESLWFGSMAMFRRAGFREIARRKPTRPVVRKALRAP